MSRSPQLPNIFMIVTDQQRRDTIGAYGSSIAQTPAIDQLANEGMTFDYAFTPCGLCSPARASMLTGVYPHSHEVLTNNKLHPIRKQLQPEENRLTQPLKRAGYQLGYVGKWHVNNEKTPCDFGFDEYISLNDYVAYRNRLGIPLPPQATDYLMPISGVDPIPVEQSRQAFLADHAIRLIREFAEDSSRPFFLRLDFHGPHPPNVIPEPFASLYPPESIPPHPNFDDALSGKPAVQKIKRQHWGTETMTWEDWQPLVAHYYGEISLIDAQVGRALAALEQLGFRENTVVFYFTDHGDTMGAHKIWNKDYTMYDEIYRIPYIVRWPGVIEPATRCDSYIHHGIDLLPTLLEIAGIDPPSDIHGQSIVPLLKREQQERPREAFCQFHGCHMGLYTMRMLQTDRYKYIFHANDIDELYDHEADPHERHNFAQDPAYSDVLRDLRYRMVNWMRETEDHLYNEWIVYWLTGERSLALQAPGRTNTPW